VPKMTPEQEAAYALDFGLDRAGLREDVQLAYDHLAEERSRARAQATRDRAAAPAAPWPARRPPGRRWYWVAIGVLLAGVVWLLAAFAVLIGQVDSFPRVPDPGTGLVSLQARSYVIYYEGSAPEVATGGVNVVPLSAAAKVGSISDYPGGLTYTFGSRTGVAVAILQIVRPGRFLIRATGAPGVPAGRLAFGSSIAGWILIAGLPAFVLGVGGVAGIVTVAIKRHRRSIPNPSPVLPS
jgi:hypothetical protein